MPFTVPPTILPVWLQIGDGHRQHLGDVTVGLTATGLTPGGIGVAIVDPDLLTGQVAALLDHAARQLGEGPRDAVAAD